MPGPSLKLYFADETEYHTVLKIAAQHDMTLPQYAHACIIRTTNEVLAERAKIREAQAAQVAESAEPTESAEQPETVVEPTEQAVEPLAQSEVSNASEDTEVK